MVKYNLFIKTENEFHRYSELSPQKLTKTINKHLEKNPIVNPKGSTKWSYHLTYNYFNRPLELSDVWFKYLRITSSKNNYQDADISSTIKRYYEKNKHKGRSEALKEAQKRYYLANKDNDAWKQRNREHQRKYYQRKKEKKKLKKPVTEHLKEEKELFIITFD